MQQGNDRGQSKREFKSRGDVNEDTNDPKAERDQGIARQLVANKLPDLVILLDAEFRLRKFFNEQFLDSLACARGTANGEEFLCRRSLRLNNTLLQADLLERSANVARAHHLLRFQHEQIAASKIDAEIVPASHGKNADRYENHESRYSHRKPALAQKIKVRRFDQVRHCDAFENAAGDGPVEAIARHEQRGKHRRDDADSERDGEPFDRSRRLPEKN